MLDIQQYLIENHGGSVSKYDSSEINIDCPNCGKGDMHFSFNIFRLRGGCFKCSFAVTSAAGLIAKLEGISVDHAKAFLISGTKNRTRAETVMDILSSEDIEIKKEVGNVHVDSELPEEFVPMYDAKRNPQFKIPVYFKNRGYGLRTIAKMEIGYCPAGKYGGRIIFPIRCAGRKSFYARRIFDWMHPKYKNPFGALHSQLLYNYDNIPKMAPRIFVVEGATDTCRLVDYGYHVVATSGHKISYEQVELLVRKQPMEVISLFDSDSYKENVRSFKKLSTRLNAFYAFLPIKKDEGGVITYYDPDDCPKEMLDAAIEDRVGISNLQNASRILKKFSGGRECLCKI